MILALGFFINGTLNHIDYREFIRTNSLSQEHLLSAKHFLQRDSIFADDIEMQLTQWYSDFTNHVMNRVHHGNSFANRHYFVYDPMTNNSRVADEAYLNFMKTVILPRILEFQQIIREDIRLIS
jgi:hypothetical protein